MNSQCGAYEFSYTDQSPIDWDYSNNLRCFIEDSDEENDINHLKDNANVAHQLLSSMESFEESSDEIPSETEAGILEEIGSRSQVSNSRMGRGTERMLKRKRTSSILNRGILAIYGKKLQKRLIGNLVRYSGRTQTNTIKPTNDEIVLNSYLTEQSNGNYGLERPFPIAYQQMELCHQDSYETPDERYRSLSQFFAAVERRMGILATQLCESYKINSTNARRILHDSIEYRGNKAFREVVFNLRKVLDKRGSYAIWFHETDKYQEDYPEDICRGYPPDYDFGVISTGFRYTGKPVVEPLPRTRDRTEPIPHGSRDTDAFRVYKYYPETKVFHDPERSIYEEEDFEEPTEGHFHILHACQWYNNECRCLGRSFDVNPRKNKAIPIAPLDEEHIRNIMLYNTKWPRWPVYIKVANGPEYEYVYRTESISKESVQPERQSQQLEESNYQNESGPSGQQPSRLPNKRDNRCSDVPHGKSSRNGNTVEKFVEQFKLRPTWPLEHILDTKDWLESEWCTYIAGDKQIQRTFQILMKITMNMTFEELRMLYQNENTMPIWGATGSKDLLKTYFSLDESETIVEELLDYQLTNDRLEYFDDLFDAKRRFITDLYEILEKKHQKTNTFQIVSPPSAGKNFFIETVLAFYWNTGVIQNFNRYHSFPLMEAVNRRVNYWDEPNFEPDATETLKKLFAGTALKASVKFQKEANVQKTPVIITANRDKFTSEVWDDRIIKYEWYQCPMLKKYTKRLHPFVWCYLVDKYVPIELI
ncbi:nonstructural protein 1 [Papilio polyxenes densovirus]|uniref:Nonstructural protein 1 n=1 Tax=Papilio polyxenes densovirus TaxID=1221208 RepID=J7GVK9_9VIRU|nr:nonstructural protein 1 [Papilio polyxenes densovirus]AFP74562.1 nonstructural protein 1 [Papilio polyxenes densovirus]